MSIIACFWSALRMSRPPSVIPALLVVPGTGLGLGLGLGLG